MIFLALALLPALAFGQAAYPNRTIRMIVPFAAGGSSDVVARIMLPKLGEILGIGPARRSCRVRPYPQ